MLPHSTGLRACLSLLAAIPFASSACGASSGGALPSNDAAALGDAAAPDAGATGEGGARPADGADGDVAEPSDGSSADAPREASFGEGGLAADRFVTGVVAFTPGPCAGFGATKLPGVVEGPPHAGVAGTGGLDVVSLGVGGEIVLSFAPNAIVDGPGADFIVFENPFYIGGDPTMPYAEPGEVSVSDDGTTWSTYPCTATSYPYGACAGWHAVFSAPGNGVSPVDPATAGGEAYDLADLGLTHARFVRIRDRSGESCPDAGGPTTDGFDLDAIAIVNAEMP